MSDPLIGQIVQFGGNFAPRGWAFCEGQLLSIASNTALFSILGTTYGGDGITTFGLPDLRGRAAVHPGQGPGLSSFSLGQRGGSETSVLTVDNLPPHTHTIPAAPPGPVPTTGPFASAAQRANPPVDKPTSSTGQGDAFETRSPYLAVNFIIALIGVFPSRP